MDEINPTNPQPVNATPPPARPKNWLVESILVTLFCCLPFGIVGIVYAASVNGTYDAGQYNEALDISQQAGKWTKLGFFVGIPVLVLYILLVVDMGVGGAMFGKDWL